MSANQESEIQNQKSIDWSQVKARLAESEAALAQALTPDAERIEAIYRERAAGLADRRAQASAAEGTVPAIVTSVGGERHGIELKYLAEVVPLSGCTPVPESPPELVGVINVRGEVCAVIDLARILQLPGHAGEDSGAVLMLRDRDQSESKDRESKVANVGLRVDLVEEIKQITPGRLAGGSTEEDEGLPSRYLKGLTPDQVIVLDMEALMEHGIFDF